MRPSTRRPRPLDHLSVAEYRSINSMTEADAIKDNAPKLSQANQLPEFPESQLGQGSRALKGRKKSLSMIWILFFTIISGLAFGAIFSTLLFSGDISLSPKDIKSLISVFSSSL